MRFARNLDHHEIGNIVVFISMMCSYRCLHYSSLVGVAALAGFELESPLALAKPFSISLAKSYIM